MKFTRKLSSKLIEKIVTTENLKNDLAIYNNVLENIRAIYDNLVGKNQTTDENLHEIHVQFIISL